MVLVAGLSDSRREGLGGREVLGRRGGPSSLWSADSPYHGGVETTQRWSEHSDLTRCMKRAVINRIKQHAIMHKAGASFGTLTGGIQEEISL